MGSILLSLGAFILACVAFYWFFDLIRGSFKDLFDDRKLDKAPKHTRKLVFTLGYLGITGRIILFFLLSILIFRVAWDKDQESIGFGGALEQLQQNSFGKVILGIVGVLLIVFGAWSVCTACFKEFIPRDPLTLDNFNVEVGYKVEKDQNGKKKGKFYYPSETTPLLNPSK